MNYSDDEWCEICGESEPCGCFDEEDEDRDEHEWRRAEDELSKGLDELFEEE